MEKYGAFRDKGTSPAVWFDEIQGADRHAGSGIAPFFPVPTQPSGVSLPFHIFLVFCRVPLLIGFSLAYFFVFCWLPIGSLGKKAALWTILGVPGIWWIDLQVDGVRRGYVSAEKGYRLAADLD